MGHIAAATTIEPEPVVTHPWQRSYPPEGDWHTPIAISTLPDLLTRSAQNFASRTVIEYRDRPLTYARLAELADQMAAGLMALGIGPGDCVALFLPNTPWHTVCFFGALKTGARLAHLSPLDAPREIMFKIRDSGAKTLITTDLGGLALGSLKMLEMGLVTRLLIGEDSYWGGPAAPALPYGAAVLNLADVLNPDLPAAWPPIKPDDVALLQYTGGTTGQPKGAMLTHGNITAATAIYQAWRDHQTQPGTAHRVIAVLPMFHVYALGVILLLGIAEGHEILLRPRFDAQTVLNDIEVKRATSFPAVPTMLTALLNEPGAAGRDFSSLQYCGSGGAPLPHEVGLQVEKLVGQPLRLGWGMTETAAAGTRVPAHIKHRPGLIGVPLPGIELRVVSLSDPSQTLAPGETGELAVRGPNIFVGYWNLPELSAEAFVDGFFLTGDIGRMDEAGLFSIVDRKKRMIIAGGFNVYPAMIENAIYEHPDVVEAIVIGVPDAHRGETAKAFVQLRPEAPELTLAELRGFLGERLGRHELPTALEIRTSLPKTAVGKPDPKPLIEEERARALAT